MEHEGDAPRFRDEDAPKAEQLLSLGIDEDSVRRLLDATEDPHALTGHLPGALGAWQPRTSDSGGVPGSGEL